jgi:hypothetical protein
MIRYEGRSAMADNSDRHRTEKVEAAERRAAAAERGEITRTTPPGGDDTQFRSRYGVGNSVETTPRGMIDRLRRPNTTDMGAEQPKPDGSGGDASGNSPRAERGNSEE